MPRKTAPRAPGGAVPALALLTLGFALVDLAPLRAAFDAVALGLAAAAAELFNLAGLTVIRDGATLRETVAGWGMEVTRVCDGNGLAVAAAGLVAALAWRRGWRWGVLAFAVALVAIQAFNLLRIVILGVVLHLDPARFDAVHLDVFPLLTAAGFLLAAGLMRRTPLRRLTVALALVAAFGAVWTLGLAALSAAPLAGLANLLLVAAPAGIGPIAPRPEGWLVETMALAQVDPAILHRAAIWPADFAIALPVILAALAAAPSRRGALALAAGLAVMVVALALGAVTEALAVLQAGPVLGMLQTQPDGSLALLPYLPPGDGAVASLRLAQNVLVHFNLLVLPGLILSMAKARAA